MIYLRCLSKVVTNLTCWQLFAYLEKDLTSPTIFKLFDRLIKIDFISARTRSKINAQGAYNNFVLVLFFRCQCYVYVCQLLPHIFINYFQYLEINLNNH